MKIEVHIHPIHKQNGGNLLSGEYLELARLMTSSGSLVFYYQVMEILKIRGSLGRRCSVGRRTVQENRQVRRNKMFTYS